MKILLVRPRPHEETIGLQSVMICEPLELMQLAAVLKSNGHEIKLADMILEQKPLEDHLRHFSPEAMCISGYISHIGVIKEYADAAKKICPEAQVFVGGVHASVCPEDFSHPSIDYVCRKDRDLYDRLGCELQGEFLPDREVAKEYAGRYYYLFQQDCALIKTSFGCPYSCNFCFCKEIAPYAARPVDQVIRELLAIPQREVYIVDDNFLFNRARLLEFYSQVKEQGIRKNYLVYGRADFIAENEDIIIKLREIGLAAVIVGIEAASQEELDSYNKKSQVAQSSEAIRILRKHDIECYATVILGVDWQVENFRRLYRFIKENRLVFVNLQPFTPMPGTPYFEEYKDSLLIPYAEHEKWDMAHLVICPTGMSVRRYYWNILALYYKITVTPGNTLYMFRKYGVVTTCKLSFGALHITRQYLKKIIKG